MEFFSFEGLRNGGGQGEIESVPWPDAQLSFDPRVFISMQPRLIPGAGSSEPRGASIAGGGVNFSVYSETAEAVIVCLFDERDRELARFTLDGREGAVHFGHIEGIGAGTRYGLRTRGPKDPESGLWHDESRLLVDPWAQRLDRPFTLVPGLFGAGDTATFVPKAIVLGRTPAKIAPMRVQHPKLVYELNVRGFTWLREDLPADQRGRVSALATAPIAQHFERLGVDVIQLMPVAAWLDDSHLLDLGLTNIWGYNPIPFMAPDPRLMPHGISDLREVTDFYRARGRAVILDVVFNHTGEGGEGGPTVSHRGLDAKTYYRHVEAEGRLHMINDMGTGNMLRTDHPEVQKLVLAAMRHWVEIGGVSGFRFDLAPALGRSATGFDPHAELLEAMRNDPVLKDCLLIAEPWDPGPGGYQLGHFPGFLEHNDRYRDDVRGFWRGDDFKLGALASRMAGSSDIFRSGRRRPSSSVNFLAVHDGFTLYDLVSYAHKHNEANGENNRDGNNNNLSWNCGAEGRTEDPAVNARRLNDLKALLATLFFSRGTPMIQQGDEMGRTQQGNNNAYAQDNRISWVDWAAADTALLDYVSALTAFRRAHPALTKDCFLNGHNEKGQCPVVWLHPDRREMEREDWQDVGGSALGMHLDIDGDEMIIWVNRWIYPVHVHSPQPRNGAHWKVGFSSDGLMGVGVDPGHLQVPARTVLALVPGT